MLLKDVLIRYIAWALIKKETANFCIRKQGLGKNLYEQNKQSGVDKSLAILEKITWYYYKCKDNIVYVSYF